MGNKSRQATETEWRIIGVSGETVDGRQISAKELEEMAAQYDPEIYGARINLEHFKFLFPQWDGGYGDVMALKTEPWEKDRSKTALLAKLAYWHKVGLDLDTSWRRVRPAATRTLSQAMHETALHAALFVDELMIATDQTAEPEMLVNPYAFLGSLPNTMPLDTAFEPAIYRTKQAIKNGYAFPLAKQAGLAYIMQTIGTALADLRRDIISVDTVQRPALTGYVRVVAPPACSRCIILAGKWFRWNEGFQRHPNCDCIHLPATSVIVISRNNQKTRIQCWQNSQHNIANRQIIITQLIFFIVILIIGNPIIRIFFLLVQVIFN